MKKVLLVAWLIVLIGMLWADRRWGPLWRAHDAVATRITRAAHAVQAGDWNTAATVYQQVLDTLPDDDAHSTARVQIELAMDTALARAGRQLESVKALDDLLGRFDGSPAVAAAVLRDVRRELGSLHYYNAWAMRLQVAPAPLWTAEAERARQQFRYLAEVPAEGRARDADALNVERVLRLEHLDLRELRALPLPKPAKESASDISDKLSDEQDAEAKPRPRDVAGTGPPKDDGRPAGAGLPANFRGFKGS